MAVEARHLNFFNPQLLANRDFMRDQTNNYSACNNQIDYGVPVSNPATDQIFPLGQSLVCDPVVSAKSSMNDSESGFAHNFTASRKRYRDSNSTLEFDSLTPSQKLKQTFVDQELLSQINQEQLEIDRLIAHHTQKLRIELEERRQRQWRALASAIQTVMLRKLWEKDEEIQRMGKLNWVLQERVKSLYVENQIWRDLAQTNEATANSLRNNLEQVLAQVGEERQVQGAGGGAEDVESCCCEGSSAPAEGKGEEGVEAGGGGCAGTRKQKIGWCRGCADREASVLVLPCRHLCLCTACGSSLLQACPVCGTAMNASVHVDMSS